MKLDQETTNLYINYIKFVNEVLFDTPMRLEFDWDITEDSSKVENFIIDVYVNNIIETSAVVLKSDEFKSIFFEALQLLKNKLPQNVSDTIFLVEETDTWYSNNKRTHLGAYSSKELAIIDTMINQKVLLLENSGGYKVDEDKDNFSCFISEFIINEAV